MPELSELKEQLDAKRALHRQIFEEAEVDGDNGEKKHDLKLVECLGSAVNKLEGAEKSRRVAEIAEEIKAAIAALDEQVCTEEARQGFFTSEKHFEGQRKRPAFAADMQAKLEGKTLNFKQIAKRVIEDPMFKGWQRGNRDGRIEIDASWIEAKTLMSTTAGFPPEVTRTGVMVDIPLRPPQLIDILPKGVTGQNSVAYMQQTTRTQAAAEVAEGAAKPEAVFVWAEVTTPVQEIAVQIPVTDVMLEDAPMIATLVETQLREDIGERLDQQALIGNGTSPNLSGILDQVGLLTYARTTEDIPSAIRHGITLLSTGVARAAATHILLHPTDWEQISTLTDANGQYIFGRPGDSTIPRMWGLPVVVDEELTVNTALIGQFAARSIQLYERRGIQVERGFIGNQFIENRQTIRASGRWALAVYRPAAFITVTNL